MPKSVQKLLKWVVAISGALIFLIVVALSAIYYLTEERLNRVYQVEAATVPVSNDPAVIARGRHIVNTNGFCTECHGQDFSGQALDDGPLMGVISVSNLTPGLGGVGSHFTTADWVRALRHGVGINGKPLVIMPSFVYYEFSDEDLGAIISYLQTLPAVDNELPDRRFGPLGRVFMLQDPTFISAEVIDHDGPRPTSPQPGVTPEYGRYLSVMCRTCHGEDLSGGMNVDAGVNLTPGGDLAQWSEADFIRAMRTGITPNGKELDPLQMPYKNVGQFTDDELKAIWLYLQSLPPVVTATPQAR